MLAKYAKKYFHKYSELLETKPMKTKVLTQAGLYIVGDAIGQKAILKQENLDYQKITFGSLAAAGIGYLGHHFYMRMHTLIQSGKLISKQSSKIKQVLTNLAIDQTFFSPFTNSIFLIAFAAMMERNMTKAIDVWSEKFEKTQRTSYMLWPTAQFFNYYCIPVQYRMLYMNIVGVGWSSVRCLILNNDNNNNAQQDCFEIDCIDEEGIISDHKYTYEEIQKNEESCYQTLYKSLQNRVHHQFENYGHHFDRNIYLMQGITI